MSMSMHIKLFRSANSQEYLKKLKILTACKEAGIDPPDEVDQYFGGDGIYCNPEFPLEIEFEDAQPWQAEGCEGLEIHLNDLPKGVSVIRFYNSW